MSVRLLPTLRQRFFDVNGDPLAGGKLYSYIAGTTTPLVTYIDSAGVTPNTNPIILDANGECDVWITAGVFKFVLTDSADVVQWTKDNVSSVNGFGSTEADAATSAAAAAATSAANASTSATNAANSSGTALGFSTAASTSATNASTSATNAANSATAAATSATNAATSESNALASKNAAATSATNAATSESNALASKNSAATSATNAANSATAAAAVIPSQTGSAGKFLKTDGSSTTWSAVTGTVAKAAQFNASTGALESSAVTTTELGYVAGATSSLQTQITTNTNNIATNTSNIATNTSNISANTTAIGTPTSAATASQIVKRDANANAVINNLIQNYATTATAAGTTTLTVSSAYQQFFTGTTTQTVVLPNVTTLALGLSYQIVNNSTGVVTINSSGGNLVKAISAGSSTVVTCIAITGTGAASWSVITSSSAGGAGSTFTITAGEALAVNDAVYICSAADSARTAGQAYKLDATNDQRMEFVGFSTGAYASGATATIQVAGQLTGFTGLSAGKPIFASVTTPGSYQTTATTTASQWIIQIGEAVSATAIIVNGAGSANATYVASNASSTNAVTSISNTYTTQSTDFLIKATASSNYTVTLPTAVGNSGLLQMIEVVSGTGVLTLNTTSSQTIGGIASGSLTLTGVGSKITLFSDGTNWQYYDLKKNDTIQRFTSGSGTYTVPVGCSSIRVRMVGSGGGGSGGGTTPGNGGNGSATTFGSSLLVANGGAQGQSGGNGGAGGTSSLGTGPVGIAVTGGMGSPSMFTASQIYLTGGNGGNSALGGGGSGGYANNAGVAAAANTGGGGGGGATTNSNTNPSGAGGGAGGFIDALITNTSAAWASSFSYSVAAGGSGGTAGTGGLAGAAGGSGYIEVTEYY